MITSFQSLPENSKIWIFPASRKFYPQEFPEIEERLTNFLSSWPNSSKIPKTAYQFYFKHFLIIGVDDTAWNPELSDHDALTHFIQKLEKDFNLILMDRINVTYKQGDYVQYKDIEAFKKLIKNRSVSKKTVVFDNMIDRKLQLTQDWEIPIMESWLGRFFKKV